MNSIARAEGSRLIRSPALLVSAAVAPIILVVRTTGSAPVLHRDDATIALTLYPMAAVTLLLMNMATLRRRRSATDDVEVSAPVPTAIVTRGLLLSVAWAVGAAVLVAGVEIGVLRALGGIWVPSPREILIGPWMVGVAGISGVMLARWLPSMLAAPVALVAVATVELWLNSPTFSTELRPWFALAPRPETFEARELFFRPAGWHLLYLTGAAAVLGALAVLRHGAGRRRALLALAGVGLLVAGVAGQAGSDAVRDRAGRFRQRALLQERQVCDTRGGVRYCAFEAYAAWIPRWERVVDGVWGRVPGQPRGRVELVSQRLQQIDIPANQTTGTLSVGPTWGRFSAEDSSELALAASAAQVVVGLPGRPSLPEGRPVAACHVAGQARSVIVMWLAARATPGAEAAMRAVLTRTPWGFFPDPDGDGVELGPYFVFELSGAEDLVISPARSDVVRALQMIKAGDQIERAVVGAWGRLLDPSTTAERLATTLDLPALPSLWDRFQALTEGESDTRRRLMRRGYVEQVNPDGTERRPTEEGPRRPCR